MMTESPSCGPSSAPLSNFSRRPRAMPLPVLSRVAAVALSLLLAGAALAAPTAVRVCKWTGKVMARCPCPERDGIEKASCCEMRAAAEKLPPAVLPAAVLVAARIDFVAVLEPVRLAIEVQLPKVASFGPAPPPTLLRSLRI